MKEKKLIIHKKCGLPVVLIKPCEECGDKMELNSKQKTKQFCMKCKTKKDYSAWKAKKIKEKEDAEKMDNWD